MRKVGIILIGLGIILLLVMIYSQYNIEKENEKFINKYIEDTTKIEIEEISSVSEENNQESNQKQSNNKIDYAAVLEIPKINLKRGVVNSNENFNSINYAISVDSNSKYPNEYGNFILYAHSGNCYFSFFKDLNKVNLNDEVYVYYDGVKYKYLITEKYEIKKTGNVNVTIPSQKNLITLITCINGTNKQVVLTGELMSGENY